MNVSIPMSFLEDAQDGMSDQAEEGDARFRSLLDKIESASSRKQGRGFVVDVDLTDDELAALRSEANYKNQYWNTDSYGIKEAGSTIPVYAAAAKRLAARLAQLP